MLSSCHHGGYDRHDIHILRRRKKKNKTQKENRKQRKKRKQIEIEGKKQKRGWRASPQDMCQTLENKLKTQHHYIYTE